MNRRNLGASGFQIAPLALGGNVFGWTADESTSFALLDAFVAAGFNLVDTADVYSRWAPGHQGGESETVIGNWLKRTGNRGRVILATKVGLEMGPDDKGLSRDYIFAPSSDRCSDCKPTPSIFTRRTRTTRARRSRKRSAHSRNSSNRARSKRSAHPITRRPGSARLCASARPRDSPPTPASNRSTTCMIAHPSRMNWRPFA